MILLVGGAYQGKEGAARRMAGERVQAAYGSRDRRMGGDTKGLIGVVGPTRMDYSAVAAKLSLIARALSERLGGGIAPPPGLDNKLIIKGDINEQ